MYTQDFPNKYEVELTKHLEKENIEFYNGLIKILNEFERHLISQGVIKSEGYEDYVKLLEQIHTNEEKELNITYNLNESFKALINQLNVDEHTLFVHLPNGIKDLNSKNSKTLLFNEKAMELAKNNNFNRSSIAELFLDVYDAEDFKLPVIKLKVFKFLDPNFDSIVHLYVKKTNRKK